MNYNDNEDLPEYYAKDFDERTRIGILLLLKDARKLADSILPKTGEVICQRRKDLRLYECDGPIEDTSFSIGDKLILVLTEDYDAVMIHPDSVSGDDLFIPRCLSRVELVAAAAELAAAAANPGYGPPQLLSVQRHFSPYGWSRDFRSVAKRRRASTKRVSERAFETFKSYEAESARTSNLLRMGRVEERLALGNFQMP